MKPRAFKPHLVHVLFAVLFSQMLAATLLMGGFMTWNLRRGFGDYLAQTDQKRLDYAADQAGQSLERLGGLDKVSDPRAFMRGLLDAEARHEGLGPPQNAGSARPGDGRARPVNFGDRVALYTADGHHLMGPPLPPGRPQQTADVRVDGRIVAELHLTASIVPASAERAFLHRQYLGVVLLTLLLTILSLLIALVGARWLARPLAQMARVADALSGGDFSATAKEDGVAETARTARALNAMSRRLADLDATRKRWLAQMSHELRTPVTVLRGELELLLDGVRKPDQAALVSLHDEVLDLGRRVEDLHLLAVADAGRLRCALAETDAAQLIRRCAARFGPRAEAAGLSFSVIAPDALPANWDEQRVGQMLGVLLDNAIRYTDAPGQIRLDLRMGGDRAEISVVDSGPCPPAAILSSEAVDSYHGSGLGLAICRGLARAHGGQLDLLPSDLGGLKARLTLPLCPDIAKEQAA